MLPKLQKSLRIFIAVLALLPLVSTRSALAWASDNGDGTFNNPVLNADYPDPDIIRVGSDFYMVTTTFHTVPGLQVLHSKDMVNWEIAGYAAPTLDMEPKYSMIGGSQYAGGVWAASLRYYKGTYYIVDNIQPQGTVVYRATNPAGPWTMNKLNEYLFDPSLLFDDDGTPLVYHGAQGNISLAVLDAGLTKALSNDPVYKTAQSSEGSHAYKVKDTYYVFNAVFGEFPLILCSRSKNRTGPFETVVACDNHSPWISPNQGGMVQLENGDWWGFSHAGGGAVGRTLWVGPITWKNDWPYFGDPAAPSIPKTNKKPNVGGAFPIKRSPTSDEFSEPKLGLQWQWNHNPDNEKWSLTKRSGFLRLDTQTAPNYSNARNTLTQRTEGPSCTGTVKIDTANLKPGDRAGLSLLEQYFGYIAVYKDANGQHIVRVENKNGKLDAPSEDVTDRVEGVNDTTLWLQVKCNFESNQAQFSYSTDGANFKQVGGDFPMHFTLATFQGERFGIFNYNPNGSAGWLDVDYFRQEG